MAAPRHTTGPSTFRSCEANPRLPRVPEFMRIPVCLRFGLCLWLPASALAESVTVVDLAEVPPVPPALLRLHGAEGDGAFGVSVAAGFDCDGDGHQDMAMAAMLASPGGIDRAGSVFLLFGDGTVGGAFDTGSPAPRLLRIDGTQANEVAGNEIWIDDVTGDGLGDLLIGRQNFSPNPERIGAGALSIVVGGPSLRSHAATLQPIDLDAPPAGVTVTTVVGGQQYGRFGIWMRSGDVDGDGLADIVVGADQESHDNENHSGAAYVLRGGSHLAAGGVVDLDAAEEDSALAGHWMRITPPPSAFEFHFGATVQIADLDGNGRGEVLVAAALNRAGATLRASGSGAGSAHGIGGTMRGSAFIAWDDNFTSAPWDATSSFRVDAGPGSVTAIHGGSRNLKFGEELLGGADYDGDGTPDLFIGDIVGDLSPLRNRPQSGSAHVFYEAPQLRGRTIDLQSPPDDLRVANFLGAERRDIAGDTAIHGDFDGDGRIDLAFSAPHASPVDRDSAGAVYVFFGRAGRWPETIDLSAPLADAGVRATVIYGARGTVATDSGDTLAYSAAVGDLDGDGRIDLVVNEMEGNGVQPNTIDVGNLIVLSGTRIAGLADDSICSPVARLGCRGSAGVRSRLRYRSGGDQRPGRLDWRFRQAGPATVGDFGDPTAGTQYALCLYDGTAAANLVGALRLPDSSACAAPGCWKASERSLRHRRADAAAGEVGAAMLRVHADSLTTLGIRARTTELPPFSLPVTAQFIRAGAVVGPCWQAYYDVPLVHVPGRFTAREPQR